MTTYNLSTVIGVMSATTHPQYETVTAINEQHGVFLVRNRENGHFFVQKTLDVYSRDIYEHLMLYPCPGIPQIINLYEEDGTLVIFEEFISGMPLSELISSHSLTKDAIIAYAVNLCDIVRQLHSLNPPIIHRDIKPSNIMVNNYGKIVLLDYNAAKYHCAEEDADTVLLGTHGYAAPEQYGFGSSSPRTDIYAIGVLLRDLVTSLREPTDVFDTIIAHCTQLDPSDRYSSVSELSDTLLDILYPESASAQRRPLRQFLPPGFRTMTPWKMIVASLYYLFIAYICLTLDFPNVSSSAQLWIERVFCLIMFLSIAAGSLNYMNIHNYLPLTKSKLIPIRIIGIILLDVIFSGAIMVTLVILEGIFFR